jgi:hypothetical protein
MNEHIKIAYFYNTKAQLTQLMAHFVWLQEEKHYSKGFRTSIAKVKQPYLDATRFKYITKGNWCVVLEKQKEDNCDEEFYYKPPCSLIIENHNNKYLWGIRADLAVLRRLHHRKSWWNSVDINIASNSFWEAEAEVVVPNTIITGNAKCLKGAIISLLKAFADNPSVAERSSLAFTWFIVVLKHYFKTDIEWKCDLHCPPPSDANFVVGENVMNADGGCFHLDQLP